MHLRYTLCSEHHRLGTAKRRRAIAAAELAVVAPLLGALVLGMCEMGRAVMVKDTLTNAARKGCRTGTTVGKSYQDILNDVNNIFTDNNISAGNATISVQVATYTGTATSPSWGPFTTVSSNATFNPQPLDQVSVKVTLPISNVLWFSPRFLSSKAVESETLAMVRQG